MIKKHKQESYLGSSRECELMKILTIVEQFGEQKPEKVLRKYENYFKEFVSWKREILEVSDRVLRGSICICLFISLFKDKEYILNINYQREVECEYRD